MQARTEARDGLPSSRLIAAPVPHGETEAQPLAGGPSTQAGSSRAPAVRDCHGNPAWGKVRNSTAASLLILKQLVTQAAVSPRSMAQAHLQGFHGFKKGKTDLPGSFKFPLNHRLTANASPSVRSANAGRKPTRCTVTLEEEDAQRRGTLSSLPGATFTGHP